MCRLAVLCRKTLRKCKPVKANDVTVGFPMLCQRLSRIWISLHCSTCPVVCTIIWCFHSGFRITPNVIYCFYFSKKHVFAMNPFPEISLFRPAMLRFKKLTVWVDILAPNENNPKHKTLPENTILWTPEKTEKLHLTSVCQIPMKCTVSAKDTDNSYRVGVIRHGVEHHHCVVNG